MSTEGAKIIYAVSELNVLLLNLTKALQPRGYFVKSFTDPMGAVRATVAEKPDIVICDLKFNDIMGLEVIQQIKIKYPDIKAILLTHDMTHPDAKRVEELGGTAAKKPVDIDQLTVILDNKNETGLADNQSGKKNILVIEKNANIRFQIKKVLNSKCNDCEIIEGNNPHDLAEKYFTRQWDLIIFNLENSFISQDQFLEEAETRKYKPDIFILLGFEWSIPRRDKFLSRGFPFFSTIPVQTSELEKLILEGLDLHDD